MSPGNAERLAAAATAPPEERDRKAEHLAIALDPGIQGSESFFDAFVFEHQALPELSLDEIDTGVELVGRALSAPLLISAMTGGTQEALAINERLAAAAEARGIALGVGSQRKAFEPGGETATFQVRRLAPSIPLLANLGAVQLNYGFGPDECRQAVEMIEADALVLHLNALQEAIQPEGQTDFRALLPKIGQVAEALAPIPVIVKEVGCGISAATVRALVERGVRVIDTAGRGGTSWARIEARRADDLPLGELFGDWGIPTPESIRQAASVPGVTVIGSGGLRSGLDVAKAIALGAHLAGMAYPFLAVATDSTEAVVAKIDRTVAELKIAMFCAGARTIGELRRTTLHERPRTR